MSGAKTNINLANLLFKRINIISTTLKTRTDSYKTNLINDFKQTALSSFDNKILCPIIYKTLKSDWNTVDTFIEAHKLM